MHSSFLNRELRYTIDCLEDAANDCRDYKSKEDVEDDLKEVANLLQEVCEKSVNRPQPVIGKSDIEVASPDRNVSEENCDNILIHVYSQLRGTNSENWKRSRIV